MTAPQVRGLRFDSRGLYDSSYSSPRPNHIWESSILLPTGCRDSHPKASRRLYTFLECTATDIRMAFEKAKNFLSYTALNKQGVNNISCVYKDVGMHSLGRAMSSTVLLPQCFFTFVCLSHNSCASCSLRSMINAKRSMVIQRLNDRVTKVNGP